MASLNSFGGSILFGVFATTLGFIADRLSPSRAVLYAQIISFLTLWMYWRLFAHEKDTPNQA